MVDINKIASTSSSIPASKTGDVQGVKADDPAIKLNPDSFIVSGSNSNEPAYQDVMGRFKGQAQEQKHEKTESQSQPQQAQAESGQNPISLIEEQSAVKAASAADTQPASAVPVAPNDEAKYIPGPKAKLVDTKSTVENMARLARSVQMDENVLLIGPTGAGKTAIVKYLAHLTNTPLRRINLNDMTDVTEIIGGYKPNKEGRPEWQDGIVVDAMKKGHWLLFDEINLADPAILERLNSLLDDDRYLLLAEKNNEKVSASPGFKFFATMNPAFYAGRKKLSKAMMNRLKKNYVDGMPAEEMVEVVKSKSNLPDKTLLQMAMFHQTVADMAEHRQIGKKDGPYPYTMRDMQKWIGRINDSRKNEPNMPLGKIIWREAQHVYEDRMQNDADKSVLEDTLKITFSEANRPDTASKDIKSSGKTVKIGNIALDVNPQGGPEVPGNKAKLVNIPSTIDMMEKIGKCAKNDEPVLLVGPTAAGKTAKVKYLANLTNNNLRRYNLSMQTDTTEFIGGYKPTGKPGEYKWTDGILVDAMRKGHWIVLDEVNLADPAILERVNSLLDDDRSLTLTEKDGEKVEAHPNFRVFATMNPATSEYGGRNELSLAMRNRFSEIYDPGITDKNELKTILTTFMSKMPNAGQLADKMVDFQDAIQQKVASRELATKQRDGFVYTIRNLSSWSKFMQTFSPDVGEKQAFIDGAEHIYASEFADKSDRKFVMELAKRFYGDSGDANNDSKTDSPVTTQSAASSQNPVPWSNVHLKSWPNQVPASPSNQVPASPSSQAPAPHKSRSAFDATSDALKKAPASSKSNRANTVKPGYQWGPMDKRKWSK